jgi:DNA polymerase (family 10)
MIPLANARRLAQKIVGELSPFCEKIEIAGSIRRERPIVADIDIVMIPKPGKMPRILERCAQNMNLDSGGRRPDPNNVTFMGIGVQLDLFFAHGEIVDLVSTTPTNWGAVLLCRTGSVQHNVQLCARARAKGLKFAPYRGVVSSRDKIVASETEEDIYAALGLKWRHPRERETLSVSSVQSVVSV